MKTYVLSSKKCDRHWDGYYTGKTYMFNKERYAVCDTRLRNAKQYMSRKRAENARTALENKIVNYEFDIEEIEV